MSIFKISMSTSSKKDIKKICRYMKGYNIEKIMTRLKEDIDYLKFMPRIHKTLYYSNDPNGEYRRIISGKYIIIYKIIKNQITILRIFNHKQNYLSSNKFILKEKSEKYKITK